MLWNNLVSATNKADAKAKIQENIHLDQWCPIGKQPLKMSLNFQDNQYERAQKSGRTLQGPQGKAHQANQSSGAKKSFKKARKEKRRRHTKEGATNKKTKKVILQLLKVIPSLPPIPNKKILAKFLIITATKKAMISSKIVPSQKKQNLAAVLTTFMSVTASPKASIKIVLQHLICIRYPVQF